MSEKELSRGTVTVGPVRLDYAVGSDEGGVFVAHRNFLGGVQKHYMKAVDDAIIMSMSDAMLDELYHKVMVERGRRGSERERKSNSSH